MIGWQRALRSPGKSSRSAHFLRRSISCKIHFVQNVLHIRPCCVQRILRCWIDVMHFAMRIVLFALICFVCAGPMWGIWDVSVSRRPVVGNGVIVRCLIVIVTVLCLLLPPGCAPSTTSSCLSQQVSWVGAVHQHTPVRLMWFVCKLGRCALPLHSLSLSHQLIHCCAGPRTLFWSKTAACRGESVHSAGLTPHR